MKSDEDAYGQEIMAHLNGQPTHEIVERDDGLIDVSSGPEAYFREFAQWPAYEQEAMDFVRGRVLDVGCGAGRVCLHAQSLGLEVVGIDVSPLAVDVCRQRGVRDARLMSITQVSSDLGTFDTIVMMGNNFGLFGGFARARRLLRRFHRLTGESGRIVAESLDPYNTTSPEHLAYHERNRRRGRMGGQARIRVRYKKSASPWFDYLLVSRAEMEQILEGTGWRLVHAIESPGPVYVAVIEKE